jgi:hypothetical protein
VPNGRNWSVAGALALLCLSSCSGIPIRSGDTVHYQIVGVGVVSVPSAAKQADVRVDRVSALGLSLADQPGLRFGLGYTSSTVMTVRDDSDVRVEVSQLPFGSLHIQVNAGGIEFN